MKFFRLLHQSHRLAVTLGVRAAEVVLDAPVGIRALFNADDGDGSAADRADAADDGAVVRIAAVAVQLDKILHDFGDIAHRGGSALLAAL